MRPIPPMHLHKCCKTAIPSAILSLIALAALLPISLQANPLCATVYPQNLPLDQHSRLEIVTFNALNLSAAQPERITAAGRYLLQAPKKPDIIVIEEVLGNEALTALNRDGLASAYTPLSTRIGTSREHQVGILVSKEWPLRFLVKSYRSVGWDDPTDHTPALKPLHTRDVIQVLTWPKNAPQGSPPFFSILGFHNKSKNSRPGDPESRLVASAQIISILEILKNTQIQFATDLPLPSFIAGDLNRDVARDQEAWPMTRGFQVLDVLDAAQLAPHARISHFHFNPDGSPHFGQIDLIGIEPWMKNWLNHAAVYPHRDSTGAILAPPTSYEERAQRISDHQMIGAEFDAQKLYANYVQRFNQWAKRQRLILEAPKGQ